MDDARRAHRWTSHPCHPETSTSPSKPRIRSGRMIRVLVAGLLVLAGCSDGSATAPSATPSSRPAPPAKAAKGEARPAATETAPSPLVFREVAAQAGLTVPHFDAAEGRFRLVESMGSGVGLIDCDGDGRLDVFVGQGSAIPPDPDDRTHRAQLYRNNGDGTFTERAEAAGVAFRGFAQGVAVGDVDGDGRDDLFVAGFNAAALYRNNGDGTFADITTAAGVDTAARGWSSSCALADLDGDGDLDLFLVGYLAHTVDAAGRPTASCNALPGQIGYCPPLVFAPEPDRLYRNNGDGTFTNVTADAGLAVADGNGLGVAVVDLDDDGRPEIFVANDKTPNLLWHNKGDLTFEEVGLSWGVAYNETGDAQAGMGIAAGDADGDGRVDLIVTNFYEEGAMFYRNTGPGQFEVATARARLRLPTRSKLGFGVVLADLDNDGALDLFLANGHVNDVRPIRMPYQMTPQLFHNDGDGRFADVSPRAGPYFRSLWLGRGAAAGDLDDDGRLDLVVTHNTGPPALLLNAAPAPGHSLRLDLKATIRGRSVRNPVGTRIVVTAGGRRLVRQIVGGTSYLSASDSRPLIGVGPADRAEMVEVRWPDGTVETWTDVATGRRVELIQGRGARRSR